MKFRIAMAMMLAIIVLCATVQAGGRTKAINPPNDDNPNYTIPHSIGRGITDDIADSPGDTLGTTYYEYQSNGNVGNKVAKDELGGYHFCWMNGVGSVSGNRHVSYNFIDENGNRGFGNVGTYVNLNEGAGYTNLDVFSDSRAAVAFHNANNYVSTLGTDVGRGFGLFTLHDIPDVFPGSDDGYWPYCTIDNQDRIHVTCKINGEPSIALYTRSDDLGQNWTNTAVIDTLGQVGTQPVSSFVSDKVAILYLKGIPGDEFGTVG
ncbi:MAG: hypothetical protein GY839_18955, partial [candidate division Zixibacteria bacterium]|nr:hypothetical protein [candidate division Zixibacteria bacterium]